MEETQKYVIGIQTQWRPDTKQKQNKNLFVLKLVRSGA